MAVEYFTTPRMAFVAMFDVLGFKNLRKSQSTGGIYERYRAMCLTWPRHIIHTEHKVVGEGASARSVPVEGSSSVHMRVFSDTVIFISCDDSLQSFTSIFQMAHQFVQSGLTISRMPFRGAIGYGDVIVDQDGLLVGTGIEDAYLGEQAQVWSGCALVGSSRVDLQACKLEYSIVSPK